MRKEEGGALRAVNLVIPVDKSEGMETALLDHFRALAGVLAHRVTAGANPSKLTGGSTFSFKMHREHPLFDEVTSLLERTRNDAQALWERVTAYNEHDPPGADALKITYYVGQSTLDPTTGQAFQADNETNQEHHE